MAIAIPFEIKISGQNQISGVGNRFRGANMQAGGLKDTIGRLGPAIIIAFATGAVVGFGRAVINAADQIVNMTNQLVGSGTAAGELVEIQNKILDVANRTFSSLEATNSLYARIKRSTRDLLITDQDRLDVTEAIQKSFALSGSTLQESSSAALQLSQALASGRLQGDEFRSISENNAVLLRAMADNLGISVGELRQMSREGKITSDLLTSIVLEVAPQLNAEFAKFEPTFQRSWQVFNNGLDYALASIGSLILEQSGINKLLIEAGDILRGIFGPGSEGNFNFDQFIEDLITTIENVDWARAIGGLIVAVGQGIATAMKLVFTVASGLLRVVTAFFVDVFRDVANFFLDTIGRGIRRILSSIPFLGVAPPVPRDTDRGPSVAFGETAASTGAGRGAGAGSGTAAEVDAALLRSNTGSVVGIGADSFTGFGDEVVGRIGMSLSEALRNGNLDSFGNQFVDGITNSILDRGTEAISESLFSGVFAGFDSALNSSFAGIGGFGGGGSSGLGGTSGLGSQLQFFSNVNGFHGGGRIGTGNTGQQGLALVQEGEGVFTSSDIGDMLRYVRNTAGAGASGTTIINNYYEYNTTGSIDADIARSERENADEIFKATQRAGLEYS